MDGIKRYWEERARNLFHNFPVVAILGARQVGKTTLARMLGRNFHYVDLELPSDLGRLRDDPELFFQSHPDQLIIDEAQELPVLFKILRSVIDKDRTRKGRFIITGSASFDLMKNISESLAGRIAVLELSAFKFAELHELKLPTIYSILNDFDSKYVLKSLLNLTPNVSLATLQHSFLLGGYPEPVLSKSREFHKDWMENYYDSYINRDMRRLHPRLDLVRYRRVVGMLSSLSGTIVNRSEIARSTEISEKAVRDYMEIIEGTYFWRSLPSFLTSKIKTTVKLPKGFFRDSGLALFLQNVDSLKKLEVFPKLGNFFESFVVEEMIRGIEAIGMRNLRLYHFRTKAGGEIDLIVESMSGLIPIEVKYASHTQAKKLTAMTNFIDLHKLDLGIVINNCPKPSMVTDKIIEIPATCV